MVKPTSAEPILRSRLLPRISFRTMMLLTALCAVIATVARAAGDGGSVAKGLLAALILVACLFLAFSVLFLFSWFMSVIGQYRRNVGIGIAVITIGLVVVVNLGLMIPYLVDWYVIALLTSIAFVLIVVPASEPYSGPQNPFAEGQLPPQILPPREHKP